MKLDKQLIKPYVIPFSISIVLLAISFVSAYLHFHNVASLLIIHFDAGRGIDFLGSRLDVFGILYAACGITIINALIAYAFVHRNKFLAALISYANTFFMLLILITVSAIISNN